MKRKTEPIQILFSKYVFLFLPRVPTVTSRIVDAQNLPEVRWPWKHWRLVSSFLKKEPSSQPAWHSRLTHRLAKQAKKQPLELFLFPSLFSCSNEMRRVLADFASSEISKQVESTILCWLLFIQPLLSRLIAQCRSPHHLPNAPWRYLPKDNHATFETCKTTIIEKISQSRSQALCNQPH